MKILLDADSCPRAARDLILRRAAKLDLNVIFAANRLIPSEIEGIKKTVQMEICSSLENSADDRIVELAEPGDLAITRDIPLAKRLVVKNVSVMDDRGRIFTENNINEILSLRNFTVGLAENGFDFDRIANYGKKEFKSFADSFDKILTRKLKQ
ncbi:MAG: DUF188 domain-containing protein [Treponema sp.]|nr:DUF188 domain-containing protein [Treponema sp.]